MTKINRGRPSGQYIGVVGDWNIYQTAEDRYKVCAIEPVAGKANYSFAIREARIDTHCALDSTKLRNERPELYTAVEKFFKEAGKELHIAKNDEIDPYGDLALTRKRTLSPDQNWKRGLLRLRQLEYETMSGEWENAVRWLHAGIYKEKISEEKCKETLAYITKRSGPVNLQVLLQVAQDYYGGKYAPNSCTTLEAQLDLIGGLQDKQEENYADLL